MSHPLIGKVVAVMCANYIYTGELQEVAIDRVVLANASIVYETGPWDAGAWRDAQRLPTDAVYIERSAVESMFEVRR